MKKVSSKNMTLNCFGKCDVVFGFHLIVAAVRASAFSFDQLCFGLLHDCFEREDWLLLSTIQLWISNLGRFLTGLWKSSDEIAMRMRISRPPLIHCNNHIKRCACQVSLRSSTWHVQSNQHFGWFNFF